MTVEVSDRQWDDFRKAVRDAIADCEDIWEGRVHEKMLVDQIVELVKELVK